MQTKLYSLVLLLLLTVGCSDESVIPSPNPGGGNTELTDGRVAFTIHTTSPTFERPVTRKGTADEDKIDGDMWVFVFDASTTDTLFLEAVKATVHEATTAGQSRRTANLKVRNHKVTLLVLDNAPAKIHNGSAQVTINNDPASWGLTTATKLTEARSLLSTVPLDWPSVSDVPYTTPAPQRIPMSAEENHDKLDVSVNLGTEAAPLPLLRVVAKLSVKKDFPKTGTVTPPNFKLKGGTVYNAPKNASLFPVHKKNSVPANRTNYIGTAGNEIIGIAPAVNDSTMMNPIYIYPSAEETVAHQPFVLIQAQYADDTSDTYYKLAIAPAGKPRGRVERNANYRLLIKECTGRGYATIDDAIAAPPSNLIYTVEVTDLSSHDILDNGQYYIGLSNSEYHFYAQNSFVNLPIATLHTGNNPGASAFVGNVTITSSDPTNLIVQSPTTIAHPIITGQTILAGVTKEFTQGTLTVRLGNLTKQIKVVRKSNSFLEIKDELIINNTYKDAKYKVASVADPKKWIKLGTTPSVTLANGQDMVASDAGGVYIAYNANMAKPDLENFVYVSRADSGRIKAHFLLSPLVFLNTNAPNVINRNAERLGTLSTGPHTFYFSNPSSYDYKVALFPDEGNPTINTGIESTFNNGTDKTLEYLPLKETDKGKLPRVFVAKVQVGGYWYEIDYYVQQRYDLKINILTVGSNGIDYHRTPTTATVAATTTPSSENTAGMFGIKVGTVAPAITSNKYSDGLGRLLYNQTGTGKPIDMPLQMYYLCYKAESDAGTANYDSNRVLDALKTYNIDILVCFAHGQNWADKVHGPSQQQAEDIINGWLLKSKYRGMIYTCDGEKCNTNWTNAIFGTPQSYSPSATPLTRLSSTDLYYYHPVYRSIMSGSYSRFEGYPTATDPVLEGSDKDVAVSKADTPIGGAPYPREYVRNNRLDPVIGLRDETIRFYSPMTYGFLPITTVQSKGFIPLLYKNNGEVVLAVHPDKRIVFQGELQYYDAGGHSSSTKVINTDGSLAATTYGPFPKMMMNMWEWFFNNVALGKKY